MNHIIINNISRNIACSVENIDGRVIYSGPKDAVDNQLLSNVLLYYYDRAFSRFLFIDYLNWLKFYNLKDLEPQMAKCIFNNSDLKRGLETSYQSLLELMYTKFGKFKKINITEL